MRLLRNRLGIELLSNYECVTGETNKTGIEKSAETTRVKYTQEYTSRKSTEPEVVKITNKVDASSKRSEFTGAENEKRKKFIGSSSGSQAPDTLITESSTQIYFEKVAPQPFTDLLSCDVFCMGWYNNEDYKTDPFSKKIIDYCKRGNPNARGYFIDQLDGFIRSRFPEKIEADIITIYPGHNGDVSNGLVDLANHLESKYSVEYKQLLTRIESRPSQKNIGTNRWENQHGSISVDKHLNGESVLLLDDIVTSGASVTIGKNELIQAGAEKVIAIGLGANRNQNRHCLDKPV